MIGTVDMHSEGGESSIHGSFIFHYEGGIPDVSLAAWPSATLKLRF